MLRCGSNARCGDRSCREVARYAIHTTIGEREGYYVRAVNRPGVADEDDAKSGKSFWDRVDDVITIPSFLALLAGGFLPLGLVTFGLAGISMGLWWLIPLGVGVAWAIMFLFGFEAKNRSRPQQVLGQIGLIVLVGAIYTIMFLSPLGWAFVQWANGLGER
jgi:hypothetical protein